MKKAILDVEIYEKAPFDFSPKIEASACYIEIDSKILLLQLATHKSESGKWGVPAGKLEKNETAQNAAIRELFEETGISLRQSSQIQSLGSLFIRKPGIDYVYHLFRVHLNQIPDLRLSDEHQDYRWASTKDLEELPLMAGAKQALDHYRALVFKKPLI